MSTTTLSNESRISGGGSRVVDQLLRERLSLTIQIERMLTAFTDSGMRKCTAVLKRKWLPILSWSIGTLFATAAHAAPESVTSSDRSRYDFKLEKGAGTPVCDAYLRRLNETEFKDSPFCGRPENSRTRGFSLFHRIPLTAAETARLYPRVLAFLLVQRSALPHSLDSYETDKANSGGHGPVIFAWHYDRGVDIGNDGARRDVIVWAGPPVDHGSTGPSGSMPDDRRLTEPFRRTQLAFVLTNGGGPDLDDTRTVAIFGRPSETQFQPIGPSLSIFRYQNETYFDTFLEVPLQDHLAVFIHRDGVTHQVCQYLYRGKQTKKGHSKVNSND